MTTTTDNATRLAGAAVRDEDGALTEVLARFAAGLDPAALPQEALHAARRHVMDILGIAVASTVQDFGQRFLRLPLATPPPGSGATAVGVSAAVTADDAALVNGTLAHGLDFDDTYQPGIVHIGAVVVPTALAVGQSVGAGSEEILAGVVLGYEVASRIAESAAGEFHRTGYHATPICGAFAAALVASRLMDHDESRMRNAMGIVGSFAAGIQEFLRDGSDTKRLHPGWAANAGIRAARFADIGFTGPKSVLEGHYGLFATHVGLDRFTRTKVTHGLGETWNILDVSIKPYPCCHLLHAHIDAARHLRASGVDPTTITRIRASIHQAGLHLLAEPLEEKRRPSTTYGAQFSLPFAVAAGLLDERIDLRTFSADRLEDPELRRLAAVTECVVDDASRYPRHFDGALEVWLADGSTRTRREEVNLGSPERRLEDDALIEKFVGNLDVCGVSADVAHLLARDLLSDGDVSGLLTRLQHALPPARS
jgi:2-methylcitrate dehydratase PrpD